MLFSRTRNYCHWAVLLLTYLQSVHRPRLVHNTHSAYSTQVVLILGRVRSPAIRTRFELAPMIDGLVAARAQLERVVLIVVQGVLVRGGVVADCQQLACLSCHLGSKRSSVVYSRAWIQISAALADIHRIFFFQSTFFFLNQTWFFSSALKINVKISTDIRLHKSHLLRTL